MRTVIILALALLCRAGDLAIASGRDDQTASRETDAANYGRSGGVGLTADRSLWGSAYRQADQRDARDAGYAACGCGSRVGPGGTDGVVRWAEFIAVAGLLVDRAQAV